MRDKGITAISYNHLNLPKQFTINPDSNTTTLIKTIYRADGLKIRKENTTAIGGIIGDLTTVSATDYLDGFQYLKLTRLSEGGGSTGRRVEELETEVAMEREAFSPELMAIAAPPVINANQSAVLQFVPTAEGFYDFTENKYIYQYKDHLGNTRLSYAWNSTTSSIDVLDRNDYYPFGMNHLNLNARSYVGQGSYKNYKYNGKELQETGMYDYGARMYMSDIGRWGVIDDLSELQLHYSPYSYVYNNPVFFNDPTGMIGEPCEKCPKPNENQNLIQEVVITAYKAVKTKTADFDFSKVASILAPIRPLSQDEQNAMNAKYGKANDLSSSLNIMWRQIKDVPDNLADTWENIKNIGESEDKEEAIVSMAILMVNLKKGKIGNVAKMGAPGGKIIHIGGVKLLTETFHKVTKPKILSQAGDFMKK
ncbi:RHS repeat-associated core domain-containing protein [Kaistella anthropi]|nr:RHS repeat-associated core domain-containing protein [Kaistella anthropi]